MLRRLALLGGWLGAAFVVHTAFLMATAWRESAAVAACVYLVGVAAMFPLHANTRGRLAMSVAFIACSALVVEGLAYAVVRDDVSPAFVVPLAVPLGALVVRRFGLDESDAYFSRHRERALAISLALGAPPLLVGLWGMREANPTPYERSLRVLSDTPFEAFVYDLAGHGAAERAQARWTTFRSSQSEVPRELRDEVERACGGLAKAGDAAPAIRCGAELLATRSRVLRARRNVFLVSALASALPLSIALLFAWRGRRGASGVHAVPDGVSDG